MTIHWQFTTEPLNSNKLIGEKYLTEIPLNNLASSDPNSAYEIRLYSSDCQINAGHYLYTSFLGSDINNTRNVYSLATHDH